MPYFYICDSCLTIGIRLKATTLSETAVMIEEGHAGDAMVKVRLATVEGKRIVVLILALKATRGRIRSRFPA